LSWHDNLVDLLRFFCTHHHFCAATSSSSSWLPQLPCGCLPQRLPGFLFWRSVQLLWGWRYPYCLQHNDGSFCGGTLLGKDGVARVQENKRQSCPAAGADPGFYARHAGHLHPCPVLMQSNTCRRSFSSSIVMIISKPQLLRPLGTCTVIDDHLHK